MCLGCPKRQPFLLLTIKEWAVNKSQITISRLTLDKTLILTDRGFSVCSQNKQIIEPVFHFFEYD